MKFAVICMILVTIILLYFIVYELITSIMIIIKCRKSAVARKKHIKDIEKNLIIGKTFVRYSPYTDPWIDPDNEIFTIIDIKDNFNGDKWLKLENVYKGKKCEKTMNASQFISLSNLEIIK